MNITRDLELNGNFDTELFDLINHLPVDNLFHYEHGSRPPLGIYSVSTSRVLKAFKNIVILLNNRDSDYEELANAHKELLDSLMAYIDDGYHLMKTLFPKNAVQKDITFAERWLKAVDKDTRIIIEDYQDQLKPYRSRLALMDNKIKHNHARHCHVELSTTFGKIKGYYIEGVTTDGVIAPNTDLHPKESTGEYTATSYNWDIKNFLIDFYIISRLISKTMFKLSIKQGIVVNLGKTIKENTELIETLELISNLPSRFFPNEYNLNIPQIIIREDKRKVEIRKHAYQSFIKKMRIDSSFKVRTIFTADGVSRSWALPYFNK